jgi:hypothetical protein
MAERGRCGKETVFFPFEVLYAACEGRSHGCGLRGDLGRVERDSYLALNIVRAQPGLEIVVTAIHKRGPQLGTRDERHPSPKPTDRGPVAVADL